MEIMKNWKENGLAQEWNAFWKQEEGVGVIEVKTTFLFPK